MKLTEIAKAIEKTCGKSVLVGRRALMALFLQACPFLKFVPNTNFHKGQKTAPQKSEKTVLSEICAQDTFFLSWGHFFCAQAGRIAISAQFVKNWIVSWPCVYLEPSA